MKTKTIYIGCDRFIENEYLSASTNFERVKCSERVIEIQVPIGTEGAEIKNDIEINQETI